MVDNSNLETEKLVTASSSPQKWFTAICRQKHLGHSYLEHKKVKLQLFRYLNYWLTANSQKKLDHYYLDLEKNGSQLCTSWKNRVTAIFVPIKMDHNYLEPEITWAEP